MDYTKIDNHMVYFRLNENEKWNEITNINKEDILKLVELLLEEDDFKIAEFNEELIKNEAHKIIYDNIYNKLNQLISQKETILGNSKQMYSKIIQKYSNNGK